MKQQEYQRIPGRHDLEEIDASRLERSPNVHADSDYVAHVEIPDFTCLCPLSGFPDFGTIIIDYVPDQYVLEAKSLKLYIAGFRNRQVGHESSPNTILDVLVAVFSPRWIRVVCDFSIRGNIKTIIFVEHAQPGYTGPRPEFQRSIPSHL
jgi:7-cyano-7-deazaguanine reductase